MRIILPIVFVATVSVALFGFSLMNDTGHTMAGCFGSLPGASCSMLSPIGHFEAHLATFQGVSMAVIGTFLLLTAALSLIVIALFLKYRKNDGGSSGGPGLSDAMDFISPQNISLAHWLAIFEKRDPAIALFAVNA